MSRELPDVTPEQYAATAAAIEAEVGKVIVGQQALVRTVVTCLLAEGHALLQAALELHVELDTRQIEIWEALQTLTERRRTALILRYYVDLPVGEIAELLECEPSSASSLLHPGLADLREELRDD